MQDRKEQGKLSMSKFSSSASVIRRRTSSQVAGHVAKSKFAHRAIVLSAAAAVAMSTFFAPERALAANDFYTNGGGQNLWDLPADWSLGSTPTAVDNVFFSPAGGSPVGAYPYTTTTTVTLGAGDVANSLTFLDSYKLTGGTLALTSGNIFSAQGSYDTISSTLLGTAGLAKFGQGTVVLGGTNTYTGQTIVGQGALVLTNGSALGSDTSTVIVEGFSSRGVQGGQLVLAGDLSSGSSITFARNLSINGRGPSTDGAALLSIGNTTFTGNILVGNQGETRFGSTYGTATVTGNVEYNPISSTTNFVLVGNGNFAFTGSVGGGNNQNMASLNKSGSGTLILSGNNTSIGRYQIDAGTIRVSTGANLGTSTRVDSVIPNGGTLEIRTDAGNGFSGVFLQANNNNAALMLDRGTSAILTASSGLNQTVSMNNYSVNNNLTSVINGRDGMNLILPTVTAGSGANGVGFTWAGNGLLTMATYGAGSTAASQGITLTSTGEVLITGSFSYTGTGATPNFNKAGGGVLTLLGSNTTATSTVPFTIANGTLSVASLNNVSTTGAGGGINIGSGGTTGALNYIGAGGGALYGGTGAGETDGRVLNINGTANDVIFANQTGSAPTALIISGLTVTGATSNSLYLAGNSTLLNTISSAIPTGTALTIGKSGLGTWVLSGNNLYTGNTAVYGGTLIIDASSATGTSTKLSDTGSIVFNNNLTAVAISTTAGTGGWTVDNMAGGTFTFKGSATAGGTQETLGGLVPAAGSANIVIDPTSASGTLLKFASLALTRGAGATVNFDQAAGGIQYITTAPTLTNGVIGGYAYLTNRTAGAITGVDFATVSAANTNISAPAYTALPTGASTATTNYNLTASTTTTGADVVNVLKIVGAATPPVLTLGGNLTFSTNPGGLLFDNTGGAASITGAFSVGTATQELVVITAGATPANALTLGSTTLLGITSGTLTKAGSGLLVLQGNSTAFTGGLNVNEGTLRVSGVTANLLGNPAAGSITAIRQLGTLDINGAGTTAAPYGTATAIATVNVGALAGGGANSVTVGASTTSSAATTNANTVTVTNATGLAVGQTVTGTGIGGYPVITAINGSVITLSSPVTVANGAALAFSGNATTGATLTNSGAASAVSLGTGTSTGTSVYTGLISGPTTVIINGTSARVQSFTGYNTYTGPTIISGGATLRVTNLANGGVASALGASSNAASNLVFNSGVLQYTGGNASVYQTTSTQSVAIDRNFTIAGNATIDSSGAVGNNFLTASAADNAALWLTNTGAVSYANTTAAARTLTLQGNSIGDNQIDLQLVNNASTTNSLGVTKAGTSLWILGNATNSYTGLTTISAGQLRAQDGTTLPTNSPLFLSGGVLETSGTFGRTLLTAAPTATSAAGGIWWSTGGGFAASSAALVVNLNGGSATALQWAGSGATAGFVASGQTLILGSTTSLFSTEFKNNIDLNGAVRAITVNDNTSTGNDYSIVSGVISNTSGTASGLSLTANAPLVLNGVNTYNGTTTILAGEVRVTSLGNSVVGGGSSLGTASNATANAVLIGNGTTTGATLTYVGPGETSDRAITINTTTGGVTLDASGSGPLTLTGTFTNGAAGAKTLSLNGLNTDANTIISNLADNGGALTVTKNSGGTWVLAGANTYTGVTNAGGGLLGLGSNSAFGTGTLTLGNGNIEAVGADRTFTSGFALNSNLTASVLGNFSLTFNGTTAINAGNAATGTTLTNNIAAGKVLTFGNGWAFQSAANQTTNLNGSGATVINGAITQTTNSGLTFSGPGSVTFGGSGTNTITGAFTQNSGSTFVNRVGAFTSNNSYVFGGGYLQNISGTALTGANALIPALLTSGSSAGAVGVFNLNGTQAYLIGNGANASIEIAGQFNNGGANNRVLFDNMTGGATLTLSGQVALSSDNTGRVLTLNGTSTGTIFLTGSVVPSTAATTLISGTLIKGELGDLNIAPLVSLNAPTNGNLVITGGSATFNVTNSNAFSLQKIDVTGNTSLNVDYNTNNVTTTVARNTGAYRTINLAGGTLNFTANAGSGTNETLGSLQLAFGSTSLPFGPTGGGTLNFVNGGATNSSLTFSQLNASSTGGSLNIVAANLGTTNKIFLPGLLTNGGFGVNARVTVNGTDYATQSANGLVAFTNYFTGNNLDNTQTSPILPQLDNFSVSSTPSFTGQTVTGLTKTVNTIKIAGNGVNVGSGTGLYQLTLGGGGILATGTGGVISAPVLNLGAEGIVTVASGADLTISSAIIGGVAFTKAGAGTLILSSPNYYTSSTVVNGGRLQFTVNNALPNTFTASTPTLSNLHINAGGTVDLNGTSQYISNLNTDNGLNGSSGTLTNTAGGVANLYSNAGGQAFGGLISGALNYYKFGNSSQTFTNNETYTGATTVVVNFLTLRDGGRLSGTTAVNVNYGATLQFDNTANADLTNRLNTFANVTLSGGTVRLDGSVSNISQQVIGAVALSSGANTLIANTNGNGGAILTMATLSRSLGATLNLTGSNVGQLYNNAQSGRVVVTAVPTLTNNLVGGWATIGGTEFATYYSSIDPATNTQQGFIALQAYTDVADSLWTAADNVKLVNNTSSNPAVYTLGGSRSIYSLNIQSTTNSITITNTGQTLTLGSGGLLSNGIANNTIAGGVLTAGTSSSPTELFILDNVNTTITAQITNNTSGGVVSVVKSLAGTTTLSPTVSNTYGGTTYVNQGTLTFGSAGGITVIPQDLVVNNAVVTFTQLAQQAAGKNLTINGAGGNVTFATGQNSLGNVTFTNNGGAATPQITGGTISMTGLTATNDNIALTPTIASTVNLNNSNLAISSSGISIMDLVISGQILDSTNSTTTGLVKSGTGSLVLTSTTSNFGGGVNVSNGALIVDSSTTLSGSTITGGPAGTGTITLADGTALLSGTAVRTLANNVTINGNVALGGLVSSNAIVLSGQVALGGTARTITVSGPGAIATLGGTLTGTQVLTKAGPGTLSVSSGSLNYIPGINVSGGVLQLDQTDLSLSTGIALSSGTTVNLAPTAAGSLGVSINPGSTPLAISGNGQLIKTGAFALNVYGNFSYTGPTTIQAGSLLLTPNAITNAAPTFSGTSALNLGAPSVGFGLDNAGATGAISVGSSAIPVNVFARDTFISTTRNADFASTLTLGTVSRSAGATGIFNFVNNVAFQPSADDSIITSNKIVVNGSTGVLDQGLYITSGNMGNVTMRTDFAYRDATGAVRNVSYGIDPGTAYSTGVNPILATSGNIKVTGSVTPASNLVAGTGPNTLLLAGMNANVTLAPGTNVINGIMRTGAGGSASGLLANGAPFLTNFMSTISGGNIDNGGRELVIRGDNGVDWLTINSTITGSAGGLTRVGAGPLVIGGSTSNTYVGTTNLLGSGTVYLNKTGGATAITGNVTIGDTANAITVQEGLLNNYSTTSAASNNQIATTAVVTFNSSSTFSLNGSSQTLAGIQTLSGSPVIQNGLATGDAQSVLTINNATDYNLGAGSILRDAAAMQYANLKLVKQGTGKLTVGIIGPMSGGLDVQGGVLALGANSTPAQLGIGTVQTTGGTGFINVASGATIDLNGFDFTVDYLTGAGAIFNSGPSVKTLTIGNLDNTNMTTGASVSATFSGVISDGTSGGTVVVQKRGAGTQALTAAQNFTAGLGVQGGTLVLDMSGLANPNNLIKSANALSLQGALSVKGAATGTSSQSFASTALLAGASTVTPVSNGGTSTTVSLATITRSANATIDFSGISASQIVNVTNANTNAILGAWATFNGVDWATAGGNVAQFSGYATLPTTVGLATANYNDISTTGTTVTAGVALNTLKLAPGSGASNYTLALGANALTFSTVATTGPAGILFDNTNGFATITGSAASGQFLGTVPNSELIITTGGSGSNTTNTLSVNAIIGGGTNNISTVTKAGPGTVVLGSSNTFAGGLRINEGTVNFGAVAASGAAQPLGQAAVTLGGNAKTATLNYTGGTATTWTNALTLGDGGIGQIGITQTGSVSTLTIGGVINGAGGLTVLTPGSAGSGVILAGTNTYLGVTTIQSGAKLSINNNSGLGASGTMSNGTIVQNGGQLDIQDSRATTEVVTINGTGIGGAGAITYSGASNDAAALLKYVILGSNATISGNGTTVRQVGVANGFIIGNGNTLTFNDTNFTWLTNDTIDNVPNININGGLVVEQMTLGGGASQTLTETGSGKAIQFRSGVIDRAVNFTGGSGTIQTSTRGGDNFITQNVSVTNAAAQTLSVSGATNETVTLSANVLQGGAGAVAVSRTGGFVVLGGTANTITGGLNESGVGTLKLMPSAPVTNPFNAANNVTFSGVTGLSPATSFNALILDNTKAGGAVSQSLTNLTTTSGGAATILLNNTASGTLSLAFTGTLTRAAGSDVIVGITGTNTAPSATNRLDIAAITGVNQGVYWNGSDYAFRDTSGGAGNQFLRPVNYGTDTGTNLVNSAIASLATVGASTNYSKIATGGSITAQATATIGTINLSGGTSLTIGTGNTLTLGTPGVLKSGGGSATIAGGTLALGTAGADITLRADTTSDVVSVNSVITTGATTSSISKFGMGRVTIGSNSAFTASTGILIEEGTLRLASTVASGALTSPLGVTANNITINNLAALELDGTNGSVTLANAFPTLGINTVNSTGFMNTNTGSIRNIAGSNSITGAITQAGGTRINSDAGSLTLSALAQGANALSVGGAGNLLVSGTSSATTGQLVKDGSGTLTLQFAAGTTFANKLQNSGGLVVLDNTLMATPTNELANTTIYTSTGGNLQVLGSATGATSQTFATFIQQGGQSRISANANSGSGVTLNLGAYAVPSDFGIIDFAPAATVTYQATAGGAAVNNNGILGTAAINGFATVGNDWATIAGTTISANSTYTAFTGANGLATTNFNMSSNQTVAVTQALNSLKLDASGAGVQLSVASGQQLNTNGLLFVGANNVTLTGGGTIGSTAVTNYFQNAGPGTVTIDTVVADNSPTSGASTVFGGAGTGGYTITSNGSVTLASNAQTNNLYFLGGQVGNPRTVTVNGGITFNSKGTFAVGHNGGDNVALVLNSTGSINVQNGTFYVGDTSSATGSFTQNGGTFTSAMPTLFAYNSASGNSATATLTIHGGTFNVGGTSGNGTYTVLGASGTFTATQDGGAVLLNRPGNIALFIGQDAGNGSAPSSYTLSGGSFSVNGSAIIGGRNGAIASMSVNGSTTVANFYQGLTLGLQDFAQGSFTQSAGTVNVGTGQNISDGNYLKGDNTIDLVLAYNQTTNAGIPSTTRGTYNLTGGLLRTDGITTGQGNGYVGSTNSAANTFTDNVNTYTTTSGGTATFNLGGGTVSPFDNDLTIGTGVNVFLTGAGSTINSTDKNGLGRMVTLNTAISETGGSQGVTFSGLGTAILNVPSTYSGNTTISSGTVKQGVANVILSGTTGGNLVLNGGTTAAGIFDLNGFSTSVNGINGTTGTVLGQVVNNGGGNVTLTVGAATNSTFAGVISNNNNATAGTIALVKTGTGIFTLGGADTYTGTTTISGGTLAVNGSLAAASSVSVGATGTLAGSGSVPGVVTLTSGGSLTAQSNGTQHLTLGNTAFNGLGTINVSNVAGGPAAAILNVGSLTVSGAASSVTINITSAATPYANNTEYVLVNYTGGTIAGTGNSAFQLGTVAGLSGRQTGTLDFLVPNQIQLNIVGDSPKWTGFDTAASYAQNGGYNTNAPGTVSTRWKSETLGQWGTTNWILQTAGTPTGFTNGDAVIFDDSVTTAGRTTASVSGAVFLAGSSVVTVTSSAGLTPGQTITGPGIPNGTTVQSVDSSTQITLSKATTTGNGSDPTVGDGSTSQILSAVTGTIAGSTTVDISNGDVTPTAVAFNNSTANYTITGANGIAGTTSLVKSGTGKLTINNANSFTGGVNLNGGTIAVGNANAMGASTNAVSFGPASNGVLQLSGQTISIGGLTGDSTAAVENGATANSTLNIGVPAVTTNIFAGVLRDGAGPGTLALGLSGAGTMVLTGANTYTGGTTISSGVLQIGNNGTSGSIIGNVTDNASLVFNRSDAVTYPGAVTGTGTVNVATGTVILTGAFSNTGATTVTSGTILQVGDGATANGTIVNVTDSGTVNFNAFGSTTYSGTISGAGTVNIATGTVVLTGGLSNTGATTIAGGATLQVGNGTVTGTLGGGITDNGTLAFNVPVASPLTFANAITGTGTVRVTNSGSTVILTGGNSYAGLTTIDTGTTLQIGSNGTTGSITGDVLDNGTLTFSRSNAASYSGKITGTGALVVNGAGALTLSPGSSANTYSAGTFIQRGTLKLGATDVLPTTGSVTVGVAGQSGTFDLNGVNQTISGLFNAGTSANQTVTNNGTAANSTLTIGGGTSIYGGVIKDGASKKIGLALTNVGTLTLSGAATLNTYTLPTSVQNGTLKLGAAGAGTAVSVITLGLGATNGVLDLNGFSGTVGGLATDPSVTTPSSQLVGNSVSSSNATLTVTVPATTTAIFGGIIQDNLTAATGNATAITINNNATGVQVFTGANTYSGTTTITAGTLQIGNAGTTGTLGTGAVSLAGTLLYNRTNTYTLATGNAITGAGSIILTGGGTLDTSTTAGLINTTGPLVFGATAGSTVLGNLAVNANAAVASLTVQTNSATADTVTIASGKTLTVTGLTTIGSATTGNTTAFSTSGGSLALSGGLAAGVVATGSTLTTATFTNTNLSVTGAVNIGSTSSATGVTSTVTVTGGSATFSLGTNAMSIGVKSTNTATSTFGSIGTLDLSGATSVSITGAATSSILLGSNTDATTSATNGDAAQGVLKLSIAGPNTVAATTITLGTSGGTGQAGIQGLIVLGNNTNNFQVDTLYVGRQKSQNSAVPAFPADKISFAGTGGTFTLGGLAGAKTALNIAVNDASGTATITVGVLDTTGGTFNATLSTLNIGAYLGASTGGGIGTLTMGAGSVTADSVVLASVAGSTVSANNAGTLNLNGGTFTINSGGSGVTSGTTATIGTATVNLSGGTLDLTNTNIGGASPATVTFNAQSGTLQNVAQVNGGGTVTKSTAGTLTVQGINTWTGATTVAGGTLALKNTVAGATLGNTAITVASGQTLAVLGTGASTTVTAGLTTTATAGASLTLSSGASTGASFTMADNQIGVFNLFQGSTFAGNALTVGGTGAVGPTLTFDLNSTSIDILNVTKGVAVGTSGGKLAFNVLTGTNSFAPAYTFITAGSGLGAAGLTLVSSTLTLPGTATSASRVYNASLSTSTATAEILTVTQQAATAAYWAGSTDANWNTGASSGPTNWKTDATSNIDLQNLPGSSTDVFFTTAIPFNPGTGNLNPTLLGQNFAIKSLTYTGGNSTTAAHLGDIGGSVATNTLTIGAGGITQNAGAAYQIISAPVILGASQTWANADATGTTPLLVSGTVTSTGTQTLTVAGTGRVNLTADNTTKLIGPVVVSGGNLAIGSENATGAGTAVNATNTLTLSNGGALVATQTMSVTTHGVLLASTGGTLQAVAGSTLTVGSLITDSTTSGALTTKGSVTLTGANTYSGGTTVSSGLLLGNTTTGVAGTSSSTGTASVTVNPAAALAGMGLVNGPVTLTGDATKGGSISAGTSLSDTTQVGTLTVNNTVTFGQNSSYVWKVLNATGTGTGPGTAYDVINAQNLALSVTAGQKFNFSIIGSTGLPQGITGSTTPYTYEAFLLPAGAATQTLVNALNAAVNFAPDNSGVDASAGQFQFQLDTGGITLTGTAGSSALVSAGPGIDLVYTPTPEPVVTGFIGLVALGLSARPSRRRRRNQDGTVNV